MTIKEIFKFMRDEIHTVVAATVDENGLPEARVIDVMLYDEGGLYFITAKGKRFYESLAAKGYMAVSGYKGADTMSSIAVSVSGRVKEVGTELVDRVFEENKYMSQIYPTKASRQALTVFKLFSGRAEYFDLSKKPIERYSLAFGEEAQYEHGYFVTEKCIGCGECLKLCPQNCIELKDGIAKIKQNNCLHCGNCVSACAVGAVERR